MKRPKICAVLVTEDPEAIKAIEVRFIDQL